MDDQPERYLSFSELRREMDVERKKRQTRMIKRNWKDMRYYRKYCDQLVSSTYKARI